MRKNLFFVLVVLSMALSMEAQYIRPVFPKQGQMISADSVLFSWNTYPNSSAYNLQIAKDSSFTVILFSGIVYAEDTLIRGFEADNSYYWRISPLGGQFGTTFSFLYFTPRMISDLVAWYAADSVHLLVDKIDTLYDKSGHSHHLIQNTASRQPTWVSVDSTINNQPTVYFDGSDLLLSSFGSAFSQPNSYFLLWKSNAVSSTFFAFTGLSNAMRNQFAWTNFVIEQYAGLAKIVAFPRQFDYTFFSLLFNQTSSYFKADNELLSSGDVGSYSMNGLSLGAHFSGAYAILGNIPEFIFYNKQLDTIEQLNINKYFGHKYVATLNLGKDIETDGCCPIELRANNIYESYLWNTGDTTSNLWVNKAGSYVLTVTDRFSNVSSDTVSVVFRDIQLPSTFFVCSHDTLHIHLNLSSSLFSFLWSSGDTTADFIQTTAGLYNLTISDSNGCQYLHEFEIVVDSLPLKVAITNVDSLCEGNALSLIYPTTDENFDIIWNTGDTSLSTVFNQSGMYSVVVTDTFGCVGVDTLTVYSKGKAPEIAFIAENVCDGMPVSFNNQSYTIDSSVIAEAVWSFGDGDTLNSLSPFALQEHTYDSAGVYHFSLYCATTSGCNQLQSGTVAVYELPVVDFSPEQACQQVPISFSNTTTSQYRVVSYQWKFDTLAVSNQTDTIFTFDDSGVYTVKLLAQTIVGCQDSLVKRITIKDNPSLEINLSSPCLGATIYFTDITNVSPYLSIVNRSWWLNGSQIATTNRAEAFLSDTGNQTIVLQVQYLNGCQNSVTEIFKVNKSPIASFTVDTVCQWNLLPIENTSSSYSSDTLTTYQWRVDGNSYEGKRPTIVADTEGTHLLELFVSDEFLCKDSAQRSFVVLPSPKVDFDYQMHSFDLYTVNFYTKTEGTILQYDWQFENIGVSDEQNPSFDFEQAGSYSVKLSTLSEEGCVGEIEKTVEISNPEIDFELLDFELIEYENLVRPKILVLSRSNRDASFLDYTFTYGDYSMHYTDSTGLAAGEAKEYLFSSSLAKKNQAQYACVELFTPYDDYQIEQRTRKKCLFFDKESFVLAVYPNPVKDCLYFQVGTAEENFISWKVYDFRGCLIQQSSPSTYGQGVHSFNIDYTTVAAGMYILEINVANKVFRQKIIKY